MTEREQNLPLSFLADLIKGSLGMLLYSPRKALSYSQVGKLSTQSLRYSFGSTLDRNSVFEYQHWLSGCLWDGFN